MQSVIFSRSVVVTLSSHAARARCVFRREKLTYPTLYDCHSERKCADFGQPSR